MYISILSLSLLLVSLLGFLISVILIWPKKNFKQDVFFNLSVFSLSLSTLYNFCFSADLIDDTPLLFSFIKSSLFLIAPCSFLYVRNSLFPAKQVTQKYDWVHFSVFFSVWICLEAYRINHVKDYLLLNRVEDTAPFTMGINAFYSYLSILKIVTWCIYGIAQSKLIVKYKKENPTYDYKTINWIENYNTTILFFFCSLITQMLFNIHLSFNFMNEILMAITLILIIFQLISKPDVLYGSSVQFSPSFPQDTDARSQGKNIPIQKEINTKDQKITVTPEQGEEECCGKESPSCTYQMFDDEKRALYLHILNELMLHEKPFLRKGYMIKDLSDDAEIPLHHLSFLINKKLNVHFQDYMNIHRIEYLKNRFNDPEWQQLSLEGMAWEAGFTSRTTFFRAFIKFTGHPPSIYFSLLSKENENTGATAV